MYKIKLIPQVFELLFNMLTTDDEYSRHYRENLPLPIQIQLSKNPKILCYFFWHFWYLHLNFEHFETKLNLIG